MIRLRRWYVSGSLVVLAALASWSSHLVQRAAGQDPAAKADDEKWALDRSVSLTPRAQQVPALRYRLLPLAMELKEGNAVPIYLRLVHEQNDESQRLRREKPAEWNKLPLNKLPVQEARKLLGSGRVR